MTKYLDQNENLYICVPGGIFTVDVTMLPIPHSTSIVRAQFPPFGGVSFVKLTVEGISAFHPAKDKSPSFSKEGLIIRLLLSPGVIIELEILVQR